MSRVLILYSTTDGHTARICERIKTSLIEDACDCELMALEKATLKDLQQAETILIGASIRYGKHQQQLYDFINQHQSLLEATKSAFFSVCLVARKPNKNTPETNPYFKKFLRRISWRPDLMAVFAGKINYPIYRWQDRLMIQFIMWVTNGPTSPDTVKEFTDWNKVDEFAGQLKQLARR